MVGQRKEETKVGDPKLQVRKISSFEIDTQTRRSKNLASQYFGLCFGFAPICSFKNSDLFAASLALALLGP